MQSSEACAGLWQRLAASLYRALARLRDARAAGRESVSAREEEEEEGLAALVAVASLRCAVTGTTPRRRCNWCYPPRCVETGE